MEKIMFVVFVVIVVVGIFLSVKIGEVLSG